jgi:type 2A phosphatase activator TIP41
MTCDPDLQRNARRWEISDWDFRCESGPIATEKEKEELAQSESLKHVPEQLYTKNTLRVEHKRSAFRLEFNVADALKQWVEDDNEAVNVAIASQWQQQRQEILQGSNVEKVSYDWTFTTSYAGHWTGVSAVKETGKQMNTELLTDRTADLVGFHEAPLFVSELDDCGASELTVRIRVTPRYWFVLLRFFLRVDGQLVRMRDVRWYWDDSLEGSVLRETRWHETRDERAVRGCVGGDEASNVLMGMAPTGVCRYKMEDVVVFLPGDGDGDGDNVGVAAGADARRSVGRVDDQKK